MAKNSRLLSIAKELRLNMTEAEKILWKELRNNKLGVKFRRQEPFVIGGYKFVADFYAPRIKLIIEVDGDIHLKGEVKEVDVIREDVFISFGYKIIRFKNKEVFKNLDKVVAEIKRIVSKGDIQ